MRDCFLGIDGGGTKTMFALCDSQGRILAEYQAGTADYRQVGIEGLKKLLLEGLDALAAQAGAEDADAALKQAEREDPGTLSTESGAENPGVFPAKDGQPKPGSSGPISPAARTLTDRIAGVCFGVPNYTEVASMDVLVEAVVYEIFPWECTLIVNDSEVGWAGSLGMEPGINLVSGTGSISFGKNRAGKTASVGGWSDFFSDEGSCHWLGIKCLELFSKEADGRLPRERLYDLVMEHFDMKSGKDIIRIVDEVFRPHRGKLASLQRILAESARQGDSNAISAYEQAADELILIAKATARTLEMEEGDIDIACSGGLFNRRSPVLAVMKRKLSENGMRWIAPRFLPHQGALLLAAEYTGHKDVVEQMKGKWEACI